MHELAALFSFVGISQPRRVRVVEIAPGDYREDGLLHVHSSRLVDADDFSERFGQLFGAGYAWVNLNYLGEHEGGAVVTLEVPMQARGAPTPSVNYSGPPRAVIDNSHGAAAVLRVEQ